MPPPSRARLEALAASLESGLVERSTEARTMLLAALAGEHVLLLGPPGTAKSLLARKLASCFTEARFFERLLTRFTVPEELFGPLSIRGLERDEYRRLTEGYLPTADVAFLDEIFKANSAILNALLTLLNERRFDNGTERVDVPLHVVVAASNEVGDEDELAALADRFLVRLSIEPVSDVGFDALLDAEEATPPAFEPLRREDLAAIGSAAREVALPPSIRRALASLRRAFESLGLYVSDRRWRKIAHLLRVAALTDGRDAVGIADLPLVATCAWTNPEDERSVVEKVGAAVKELVTEEPQRLAGLVDDLVRVAEIDEESTEARVDDLGRPLYRDRLGELTHDATTRVARTNGAGDFLFKPPPEMVRGGMTAFTYSQLYVEHFKAVPHGMAALKAWAEDPMHQLFDDVPNVREQVPRRYSDEHVRSRVKAVDDLRAEVRDLAVQLARTTSASLWPTSIPGDVPRSIQRLEEADERLAALRRTFESLPRRT